MSMDRNVWIYGTGLLVIVGGCFAIGYTVLPTKPAFGTKQVVSAPATNEVVEPTKQANTEPQVPKLVIEDITAEKASTAKPVEEPVIPEPELDPSTPEELDIKVDTSKKSDSTDVDAEPFTADTPPTPPVAEPSKAQKPIRAPKPTADISAATPDAKIRVNPPVDDSVALFRVRIATMKTTRKDANALVSELKDKGFSATVLPLAGSFVIQTGAFKDRKSAEALQKTLTDNGYDTSITN
jgi:cell division septation protein DedD